jgi:hypothetical protein
MMGKEAGLAWRAGDRCTHTQGGGGRERETLFLERKQHIEKFTGAKLTR